MRENKYLEAFGKPFPASDVSWRLQYVNEQRMQGIAVPYLDARAVADRIDEVVGQNRWKDSFTPWHDSVSNKKTKSSQLCTISIYDDELDSGSTRQTVLRTVILKPLRADFPMPLSVRR